MAIGTADETQWQNDAERYLRFNLHDPDPRTQLTAAFADPDFSRVIEVRDPTGSARATCRAPPERFRRTLQELSESVLARHPGGLLRQVCERPVLC